MMDALILARMQFAANITFHILFPTISIGLGWLLLWFRLRWLQTRDGPDPADAWEPDAAAPAIDAVLARLARGSGDAQLRRDLDDLRLEASGDAPWW